MISHAGQFLYIFSCLGEAFAPRPWPSYLFPEPLNCLDFDPTYPKKPITLGGYTRKFREDKGISRGELAKRIGIK